MRWTKHHCPVLLPVFAATQKDTAGWQAELGGLLDQAEQGHVPPGECRKELTRACEGTREKAAFIR